MIMTTEQTMKQELDDIIHNAKHEIFYDGMDSVFSIGLHELLDKYDKDVIITLQHLLKDNKLPLDMVCEAFIQCGHIENSSLDNRVILFAEQGLKNKKGWVRDSAGLCLASLDNPIAIPVIQLAVKRERNHEVKEGLEQVLDQLIATRIERTREALKNDDR